MQQRLRQFLQKLRPSRCRRDHLQSDAEGDLLASLHTSEATPVYKRLAKTYQNRRKNASVFGFLLCAFSLPSFASADSIADAGDLSDFIVNIARYTSWPGDVASKGLTVCFAHGGALMAPAASATSATSATPTIVGDTPREVRRLPVTWRHITSPAQVPGCNIVWLHADVRPAPREWLSALHDRPILTLSNYADFTADGGIIGAYRSAGEWRFEVSLEGLQRSRLSISAVALRLSHKPRPTALVGGQR